MAIPQEAPATAADYWGLSEGRRAELVEGELYDMAPPSIAHQKVVGGLFRALANHVEAQRGDCLVLQAPVAVDLAADESTWVEPDVLVVCDSSKVTERAVVGAPDFVAEVVSPSSMRMDSTRSSTFTNAPVWGNAGSSIRPIDVRPCTGSSTKAFRWSTPSMSRCRSASGATNRQSRWARFCRSPVCAGFARCRRRAPAVRSRMLHWGSNDARRH